MIKGNWKNEDIFMCLTMFNSLFVFQENSVSR